MSNIGSRIKRRGVSVSGEGLDHSSLSWRSEPAVVAESEPGWYTEGNDDLQPENPMSPWSMVEREREPGGSDGYAARPECGQNGLHPHEYERPGPSPSQEEGDAGSKRPDQDDPSQPESNTWKRTPSPPILQDGESDSPRTAPFQPPPLTDDAGNPAVPGPADIGAATSMDQSGWNRTGSSATKFTLQTAKEASDAFSPLKSIAEGLRVILDNCEVWIAIVR